MLTAIAFLPGTPLIVPEISGPGAAADVGPLREAVLEVGRRLADGTRSWIVVGVAAGGDARSTASRTGAVQTGSARAGTFAGFGVDVRVSLDPDPGRDLGIEPAEDMAAPLLVAGWLRGQVAAGVGVDGVLVDPTTAPAQCVALGDDLARRCSGDDPIGVLVVGDGSTGLSARAPSGLIHGAIELQSTVDAALGDGDVAAVSALDVADCSSAHIDGRAAWQVAAALWSVASPNAPQAESLYRDAPFGVGYQVAWWGR